MRLSVVVLGREVVAIDTSPALVEVTAVAEPLSQAACDFTSSPRSFGFSGFSKYDESEVEA